jgi:hypothetical protein
MKGKRTNEGDEASPCKLSELHVQALSCLFFMACLSSYLVGDKNVNRVPQKKRREERYIELGEVMAPYIYISSLIINKWWCGFWFASVFSLGFI